MSTSDHLDLDDLQQELRAAERLIKNQSNDNRDKSGRASLEESRRIDILSKFGRRPLDTSLRQTSTSASITSLRSSGEGQLQQVQQSSTFYDTTPSGILSGGEEDDMSVSSRYSTPAAKEELIERLLAEHRAKKGLLNLNDNQNRASTSTGIDFRDTLHKPLTASVEDMVRVTGTGDFVDTEMDIDMATLMAAERGSGSHEDWNTFYASEIRDSQISHNSQSRNINNNTSNTSRSRGRGGGKGTTDIDDTKIPFRHSSARRFSRSVSPNPVTRNKTTKTTAASSSSSSSQGRRPAWGAGSGTRRSSPSPDIGANTTTSSRGRRESINTRRLTREPRRSRSVEPHLGSSLREMEFISKTYRSERLASRKDRRGVPPQRPMTSSVTVDAIRDYQDHYSSDRGEGGTTGKKYLKSRDDLEAEFAAEWDAKHTFQPQLATSKYYEHSINASHNRSLKYRSSIDDRIQDMLDERAKKLQNRDSMKRDLERSELLECTFQPRITKRSEVILKRAQKLHDYHNEEGGYNETGVADLPSSSSGTGAVNTSNPATNGSVADRLFEEARSRARSLRKEMQRKETQALTEHSFHPTINPKTIEKFQSDLSRRPIYERIGEVQRDHKHHMQKLRDKYLQEEAKETTFEPKIGDKSSKLADKRRSQFGNDADESDRAQEELLGKVRIPYRTTTGTQVADRLHREGRELRAKMHKLRQDHLQEEDANLQQAPVSKGSAKIAMQNAQVGATTFDERQQIYKHKSQEKEMRLYSVQQEQTDKWFKPQLSKRTEQLAKKAVPNRHQESPSDKIERLQKAEQEKTNAIRDKENLVYQDVTFKPNLAPSTNKIAGGRGTGLEELYTNRKGQRTKERAAMKMQERLERENTFKPHLYQYKPTKSSSDSRNKGANVSTTYNNNAISQYENTHHFGWQDQGPLEAYEQEAHSGVVRGYTHSGPVDHYRTINLREPEKMGQEIRKKLQEKEERRQAAIIAREMEELKECTFQPHIPEPKTSIGLDAAQDPVVVRGIGRHIELRQMSNKLKQEKIEREREVFNVQHVDKYRDLYGSTIIQPFTLSGQSNRPSRAVLELHAREDAELTFAPVTTEMSRKDLVKHLLEEA